MSTDAWTQNPEIGARKNIKVSTDYNFLQDNLVRKTTGDTAPIFSFDYKQGTNNQLEITPKDPSWFLNHFKNYNRMIGLFAQFEYQSTTQSSWTALGKPLKDNEIDAKFQGGKLTLDTNVHDIKKLRFKLVQDPTNNSGEFPVEFKSFDSSNSKYISSEHQIASERYIIKNNQIQSKFFANKDGVATKYLNDITKKDIEDYVTAIVNESTSDADIKSKVTLKFEYDGETDLTAEKLFNKIYAKISGTNPFAISSDGNGSGDVIKAYFSAKSSTDGIVFVNENGNVITEEFTKTSVKSNLITKIDVSAYITQITTSGLTVNPPATIPGTFNTNGNDIQFPRNESKIGFLSNMSFQQIKDALSAVGVTIRFKGYDLTTNKFGDWQTDLSTIKNYDPSDPQIKIGFQINSNWKVKMFNGTEITDNTEIVIKLNLPKLITINDNVINAFKADHGIGGNTKNLTFNLQKITNLINSIKNDNANQQIPEINNAPLEVVFKLSNTTKDFVQIQELKDSLSRQDTDVKSNKIEFKIKVSSGKETEWILSDNNKAYELLSDQNDIVPIFVHDNGIWEDVKIGTTISGTNENLTWKFPTGDGFGINDDDTFADSSSRGKGLKLEFTTDMGLDVSAANGWGKRITQVNLGTRAILLRIVAKNNSYIYQKTAEKNNVKIQINLDQIREQINVQSSWLTENIITQEMDINQAITTENLQKYEKSVMDSIPGLDQETKDKLTIKYSLDNNNGQNSFVDKSGLVDLIKKYQNTDTFDILQLWNGHSGVKIFAKFAKSNESGLYDLVYPKDDPQQQQLNTDQITTTIEFDKVIKWLTETQKLVDVTAQGNEYNFQIPSINVSNDPKFNNKSWQEIINFFKQFGISIQYREVLSTSLGPEDGWRDNLTELKQYDPNIGKVQIRFKFDQQKSKNIKLKISDKKTYHGKTEEKTEAFSLSLNIRLILNINKGIVDVTFINKQDVISGNTKYLSINEADETTMIQELINDNITNNPAFKDAALFVKYKLDGSKDDWKTRQEFIDALKAKNDDQTSNN